MADVGFTGKLVAGNILKDIAGDVFHEVGFCINGQCLFAGNFLSG